MSIAAMTRLAVPRSSPTASAAGASGASNADAEQSLASAIGKITAFIPTEAVGGYTAAVGIFTPAPEQAQWLILIITLLLTPVYVCVTYIGRCRRHGAAVSLKKALVLSSFAMVSLVAWAAALPATPFLAISPYATRIGGAAVIFIAPLLSQLAELWGILEGNAPGST